MRGFEERRLGQAESSDRDRGRRFLFRRARRHSSNARGQARPRPRGQGPSRSWRAMERSLTLQPLRRRFGYGSWPPGRF